MTSPAGPWKVLIVDDDPATALLQQRCLERRGYRVSKVASADHVGSMIRDESIDLIVLDYQLGEGVTGPDVYRSLRNAGLATPVILVTGFSNEERIVEALRDGVRDFVIKVPDYLDQLATAVDRAIAQIGVERQLAERDRRAAVLYEVTRLLSETRALAELVPDVLRVLTRELGWQSGCMWKVDALANVLRCVEVWHTDDEDVATFAHASRQLTFERGVGLPGQAWANRSAVLDQGLLEPGGPRAELFASGRLSIALAHPFITHDEVRGVMEFCGRSAQPPDAGFMDLLGSLGLQVSQLVERKQIEDQLLAAQNLEAVGRLAGGIAHDFNNLLTVITGQACLLLDGEVPPADQRSAIEDIQDAATQAAVLTRQLLAFSRKQLLKLTSVDLKAVVESTLPSLGRIVGDGIELRTYAAPDLGRVKADAGQIEQILVNFAVNAVDAMPDGGTFSIDLRNISLDEDHARQIVGAVPGHYVLLAVSDTGRGMEPATLNHIFDPYFSTKPRGRGTGLGLAMVYGVIKQTGGHIWVYSEPGKGTIFKTYFPQFMPEPGAGAAVRERGSLEGDETILVVEDEPRLRTMVQKALEQYGYQVLVAMDGAAALEVATARGDIDLLVSDVMMPGISAQQLRDRLAAACPGMRMIWMSGYTEDSIIAQGILDGSLNFLGKPFSPDHLVAKIRQVLDGS